jgi:hypothetical protein
MEFLINHTHKNIRCVSHIDDDRFEDTIKEWGWTTSDSYDFLDLVTDGTDAFDKILDWIENDKYSISEEDRHVFVYDYEDIADQYDEIMASQDGYSYDRGLVAWDNPVASFDW